MKKIVFSKELFIESVGIKNYNKKSNMIDNLDGKEIDGYFICNGSIFCPFFVDFDWCKEIEVQDEDKENK